MSIIGYLVAALSGLFFWGCYHAIEMYQIQGDPRWFLSIIGCPIFGAFTLALGMLIARAES